MSPDKKVKKQFNTSWLKLAAGLVLVAVGVLFGAMYFTNDRDVFLGFLTVLPLAPGLFLLFQGMQFGGTQYAFVQANGRRPKYTGKENCIIHFAYRDPVTNKDVPLFQKVMYRKHIPKLARLHYVRNFKKHFYELHYNTAIKKLVPTTMPDKRPFLPARFAIAAAMQPFKDCMEYNPPTMLQKLAPPVLLGTMGLVGLLMVMTGG